MPINQLNIRNWQHFKLSAIALLADFLIASQHYIEIEIYVDEVEEIYFNIYGEHWIGYWYQLSCELKYRLIG